LISSHPENYSKDYPVELAELFRELGQFNEAISLLQNISAENQDRVTGLILKMAIEKHTAPIRYRH
jgi:thioredoxin-like negative regulator of GroEL